MAPPPDRVPARGGALQASFWRGSRGSASRRRGAAHDHHPRSDRRLRPPAGVVRPRGGSRGPAPITRLAWCASHIVESLALCGRSVAAASELAGSRSVISSETGRPLEQGGTSVRPMHTLHGAGRYGSSPDGSAYGHSGPIAHLNAGEPRRICRTRLGAGKHLRHRRDVLEPSEGSKSPSSGPYGQVGEPRKCKNGQ